MEAMVRSVTTRTIITIAVNIYYRPYLSHEVTLVVEQRNVEKPDFGPILEGRDVVMLSVVSTGGAALLSVKNCFHWFKFSTLSFRRKCYTFSTNCWTEVKIILKHRHLISAEGTPVRSSALHG